MCEIPKEKREKRKKRKVTKRKEIKKRLKETKIINPFLINLYRSF